MSPRRALVTPTIDATDSPWETVRPSAGEPASHYTPPSSQKAKRNRQWEQRQAEMGRVVTSYRLPQELRDAISSIAQNRLHVPVDDLARVLLEHALEQYRAGALELHPRPKEGRFTL